MGFPLFAKYAFSVTQSRDVFKERSTIEPCAYFDRRCAHLVSIKYFSCEMAINLRLLERLHNASILCDASRPCKATLDNDLLTVCLPEVNDHGRLCQPFGVEWQRIGMPIYKAFGPQKCECFDIYAIRRWANKLRTSSAPLINRKNLDYFWEQKPNGGSVAHCINEVIERQPKVISRYAKCAFVGSGNLKTKGKEIDSYDAVFRANTHVNNFSKFEFIAGTRMDYVSNCLFNGRVPKHVTNCIVPSSWWKSKAGTESWNNSPNECCVSRKVRSDWSCERLRILSKNHNFIFHNFHMSGVRSIDVQLLGSGGTSFHTSMSLCRSVHVYGVGITNLGLNNSKIYQHYYDPYNKQCQAASQKVSQQSWLRDRISSEIVYNLLHVMDIITMH